jgi:hypothetical protein
VAQGLTGDLLLAALAIWIFSVWILSRDLPRGIAIAIATLKATLPILYFAYLYDGIWTFKDDWVYYYAGTMLLRAGYDPISILLSREGILQMGVLASGSHILYHWYNLLAQYLFGTYYYSPIFLNVGLTCIAGAFFYRIVLIAGVKKSYAQGLLIFFLLHWDVLAWSTLANLKDILVLTLTTGAHYFVVCLLFVRERLLVKSIRLGGLFAFLFAMLFIRFYLPVLTAITLGIWSLLRMRGWAKLVVPAFAAGIALYVQQTRMRIPHAFVGSLRFEPGAIVPGLIRFWLTPQPWSIAPSYSFLLVPSILHWLMFIPALIGGYRLWRQYPIAAYLLIYLMMTSLFYAVIEELQGPRTRVQLVFIIAWAQYHFLYMLYQWAVPRLDRMARARYASEQIA